MGAIREGTRVDEQQLIEQYIDREWDRYPGGRADARLKGYGVPVWALIGHMGGIEEDPARTARDYQLPVEAVEAALAYYRRYRPYIDAHLLLNTDSFEKLDAIER